MKFDISPLLCNVSYIVLFFLSLKLISSLVFLSDFWTHFTLWCCDS